MNVRNVDDCFEYRLLRKIPPDMEKVKRSMDVAKERLSQGEMALKANFFQFAILEAYMAMFHASRALLYKDGIQEKSHFAIFIYLKEKYANKIPMNILNFLNIHRIERHETMYGLEYKPEIDDAFLAMNDAKVFVNEIEKILQRN
ncbi:MAG: HEPN domain-containing protein [Nanoarchaeota archaeon]|nr:HEPN domain-containing protein [Nanoarchaeota archaeon]MBU4300052.1 HEPN domain-containing protein [Nanoarchaeota archaeon]MBU4451853.1 HEPN domain-containing protein [Nanoarchaeota archaeon]MCG2724411.1 HEPN domain-containing protein [archaeon]